VARAPPGSKRRGHATRIMKEIAHADELKEAEMKNLKHANKLYNDKIAEEKKAQRARD
jgi:hypothetical protein